MDTEALFTATVIALLLVIGALTIRLIWRLDHPYTKFWAWIGCVMAKDGGHLPVPAGEGRIGHRCAICGDALHPSELPEVSTTRHTYVREKGQITRGAPFEQPSQDPVGRIRRWDRPPYTNVH
jgi:hypothetical protein